MRREFLLVIVLLTLSTSVSGQTIAKEPGSSNEYYFRGLARENAGGVDGAIADFTTAIQLDEAALVAGDSKQIKAGLAEAYYQRGRVRMKDKDDLNGALADFDRAIILVPSYIAAYRERALARRIKNDPEGAKSDLKKAESIAAQAPGDSTSQDESSDQGSMIPINSKIYLAERDGFEKYLEKAIQRKQVALVVVADRSKADFEIRAGIAAAAGTGLWEMTAFQFRLRNTMMCLVFYP